MITREEDLTPQEIFDEAMVHYDNKAWHEAIDCFREVIDMQVPPWKRAPGVGVEENIYLDCLYQVAYAYRELSLENLDKKLLANAHGFFLLLIGQVLDVRKHGEISRSIAGLSEETSVESRFKPLVSASQVLCDKLLAEFDNDAYASLNLDYYRDDLVVKKQQLRDLITTLSRMALSASGNTLIFTESNEGNNSSPRDKYKKNIL